ncbi:MAG: apolipoprotein N-acyltransferase [Deltaproteobacteria bacterium]|nr:apolipoprotein N-acyltransferase [Deltaproteobacteria bacterium]
MPRMVLSVLSGVLLTLGFPSLNLYFISWVALVPLMLALRGRGLREAFVWGYTCGLVHNFTVFFWIRYVIHHYGGLPLPLALGILLLLCLYLGLYQAGFALMFHFWERRPRLMLVGLPCAWVLLEFIRAHAVTGFPWANLGYTQTPLLHLIQFADITGVYGVGWLVVLGNAVVFAWFTGPKPVAGSLVFALCLWGAFHYGDVRIAQLKAVQETEAGFNVAVIQGNIDQSQKWKPAFQQETLRRYRQLSMEAVSGEQKPELLVWPETSAPFLYGVDERLTEQLNAIIEDAGVPILFGSPSVVQVDGAVRFQNKAYLSDGTSRPLGEYAKQHLVPFGEYVPLQRILFFVNRLVEFAGDFVPGRDVAPILFKEHSLGVLICYEGIFPYLARRAVTRGATALVNITNDAWYGPTSAPYQHMEISRWRAVEFRRPLIRSANTGISTFVGVTGDLCGTIPLNEQGFLVCRVRPCREGTFYGTWGDAFAWICVVLTAGGMLLTACKQDV